jgi:Zn-dependent alcohol dehydrogenase
LAAILPGVSHRIRAAVCREFGTLRVEEVDLRRPGVGEVGVRVAAAAVCHSDLALVRGAWEADLPAVFGHEVAGVVDEVGDGVVGLRAGDHAVVTLIRSCGLCTPCVRGQPALCERRGELPLTVDPPLRDAAGARIEQGLRTGGFAERVTVHASQVVPIPAEVPLESAAVLGCGVITGVGAVLTTAAVEVGATLGVVGAGGVGLNAVQGGVLAGASLIVAIDPLVGKRAAALAFGATDALDPADDLAARVAALTGGRGFDHVVVTAAASAAVTQALTLVASGGAVTLVGMPPGATVAIEPEVIAERGLRILGSKVGGARPQLDVPRLADLYLQGRLRLDELVSARFGLDEIERALATATAGEALRVVIVP